MKRVVKQVAIWMLVFSLLVGVCPLSAFAQFNDDELDWNDREEYTYYTYTVSYNTVTITQVDTELMGNITVPSFLGGFPVVAIGDSAFSGCVDITSLTVPEGITSLGTAAFAGCTGLTAVVLPESLKEIPVAAFTGCAALAEITLPMALKKVGSTAFTGCVALADVYYGGFESDRESIAVAVPNTELLNATWHYDETPPTPESHLYYTYTTEDGIATIVTVSPKISGNAIVPTLLGGCPVVAIDDEAFMDCTALTGLVLPAGLTTIGARAFAGCTSLTSVVVPDCVTKMGESAFSGCTALSAIALPDNLSALSDWTFYQCAALTHVALGDRVTTIGRGAFYACTALAEMTLPDTLVSVQPWAFAGCAALAQVDWGKGLAQLGDCAFADCVSLTELHLPDIVSELGTGVFAGCTGVTAFHTPASLAILPEEALKGCTALTELHLSTKLETIESSALQGCSSLTTVTASVTLTEVGENAFLGCAALTDVVYQGTVAQKNAISIAAGNASLLNAAWQCASTPVNPDVARPTLTVDSATAKMGSDVTLGVQMSANPGVAFAILTVTYDAAVLTLNAVQGVLFEDLEILSSTDGSVTFGWVSVGGNLKSDGTVANLLFTVNPQAADAVAPVTLTYIPDEIYNTNWQNVAFATVDGAVSAYLHVYDDACDGACNDCGAVREAPHAYDNACDAACNLCGEIREVGDHVYDNACDAACNLCGEIREVGDHVYDNACDADCNHCGVVREVGDHVYAGDIDVDCDVCGGLRVLPRVQAVVDTESVCPGGTVTVRVTMYDNPGLVGWSLILGYDASVLEAVALEFGETFNRANAFESETLADNPYYVAWVDGTAGENNENNGVIYTITFRVKEDAPIGTTLLDLETDNVKDNHNKDLEDVVLAYLDGQVTVTDHTYSGVCDTDCNACGAQREAEPHTYVADCDEQCDVCGTLREAAEHEYDHACDGECNVCGGIREVGDHVYDDHKDLECNECGFIRTPPYTPGDVNNDGKVNMQDITSLQRIVARWQNVPHNPAALDCNGDGKVNMQDVTHLQRYVARWNGIVLH